MNLVSEVCVSESPNEAMTTDGTWLSATRQMSVESCVRGIGEQTYMNCAFTPRTADAALSWDSSRWLRSEYVVSARPRNTACNRKDVRRRSEGHESLGEFEHEVLLLDKRCAGT